jgi:hypothetical protein
MNKKDNKTRKISKWKGGKFSLFSRKSNSDNRKSYRNLGKRMLQYVGGLKKTPEIPPSSSKSNLPEISLPQEDDIRLSANKRQQEASANKRQQEASANKIQQKEAEFLQTDANAIARTVVNQLVNQLVNQFKVKHNTVLSPNKAATKLQRLYTRRRKHQLYSVCPNPDVCIAFGKETKKINLFFNGFTDFKYMDGNAIRIGVPSVNGFVKLIQYSREGYSASAILKSNQRPKAGDNLYYEYLVGQFINQLIPRFPCFLETYGMFLYKDDESWKLSRDNKITSKEECQHILNVKDDIDISTTCTSRHLLSILVQSVPSAITLYSMLATKNIYFNRIELIRVLFQVYMPLSILSNHFTHYDLHNSNVLLYDLKDEYIEYNYVMNNGETVSFKSSYIVKIIDYGRCYFNYKGLHLKNYRRFEDSEKVFNELCLIETCNPDCGYKYGYSWLYPKDNKHFLVSSVKNSSHDLELLRSIRINRGRFNFGDDKYNNFIYNNLLSKFAYSETTGRAENLDSGYPTTLNNVSDACLFLRDMLMDENSQIRNNPTQIIYENKTQIGTLTVYADGRPMEYVPS